MLSKKRLRAIVPILVLALTGVAAARTAFARTAYDGDWSVLIATSSGACGPSYRYGVQISDGVVIYQGGMVTIDSPGASRAADRFALDIVGGATKVTITERP